jgi:hypothetical protein
MRRNFSCEPGFLVKASVITTLGAAAVACSGEEEADPGTGQPDAAVDQVASEADVDAGMPDAAQDCQPMAYYGPPMCSTDEECEQQNGAGSVCDKTAGFEDPCQGKISWPVCTTPIDAGVPDATDEEPMAYYGPVLVDAADEGD